MEELWTLKQLMDVSRVKEGAIRTHCNQFAQLLSPQAAPPTGKTRRFTPKDVAILLEIQRLTRAGKSFDEVEKSLAATIASSGFDDSIEFPDPETDSQLMSVAEHRQEVAVYKQQLAEAEKAQEKLAEEKKQIEEDNAILRGRIIELERQLDDSKSNQGRIEELKAEIAVLKYRLEEQEGKK